MFGNNFGNGFMNPYAPQPSPSYPGYQPQQQYGNSSVPKTNMIMVTSLEDAMLRYAEPNSNMLYIDQDKPLGYRIMTDMQGRKTYKIVDLIDHVDAPKQEAGEHLTRADVEEIARKQFELLMGKKESE